METELIGVDTCTIIRNCYFSIEFDIQFGAEYSYRDYRFYSQQVLLLIVGV